MAVHSLCMCVELHSISGYKTFAKGCGIPGTRFWKVSIVRASVHFGSVSSPTNSRVFSRVLTLLNTTSTDPRTCKEDDLELSSLGLVHGHQLIREGGGGKHAHQRGNPGGKTKKRAIVIRIPQCLRL